MKKDKSFRPREDTGVSSWALRGVKGTALNKPGKGGPLQFHPAPPSPTPSTLQWPNTRTSRREREKFADKALAFITGGQTKIEKENEQWKDNYNGLKDKYNDLAQRFKGLKRELAIKDERIEAEISERDELRKEYDNYIREQSGIKTKLQNETATLKKEVSTWYGIVKDICKYIKAITDPGQQSMWKNWIDRYVKPEQMQTIEKDMQNEAKQQTQTSAHRYGRGI